MGKLIKPAVVGALVVFVWGMVSWMALPWHEATINSFQRDGSLSRAVQRSVEKDGIYFYPWSTENTPEAQEEAHKKMEKGPIVFASVIRDGAKPNMGKMMAVGFILNFLVALSVLWLLTFTKKMKYWEKVRFMVVAVSIGVVLANLLYWNWWFFDPVYTLVQILDSTMGWTLGATAMAKMTK